MHESLTEFVIKPMLLGTLLKPGAWGPLDQAYTCHCLQVTLLRRPGGHMHVTRGPRGTVWACH